ncbi:hypothetical protein PHYBLDRAFT_152330 [Phycomyces blakesleeanus NRRL 1555(-)]|uniref:tRNA-splicing endonuclease subunit Sen15 domain-containing protein n=1 Tax=Phycomyces blakesleeanus (strain ATCC 8743b / DSM 1359 / FGSC 10004 / NBRC 33097 / NRRL 1555) TaxID=763407 RepID=A0A167JQX3_PHYB8|nr:hypothetical protein PHYBLDRAFT_152330 [Phycomyces blakesleeanus NRRL 1555(-)]OAD66526.1 hypothetical protein PHYBLDRAFT_152330 [Phycomyces blakesleeanus NRRL 1555(-)]|eukprot:XP_018284566.1 hypothetical protein PHYBLDRAFT_152330 [Phycomyces blakesleeanus NRRL 1555(-)]
MLLDTFSTFANVYPKQTPLLKQVYFDLVLEKTWKQVKIEKVDSLSLCAIVAHEPGTPLDQRHIILPIHQETQLSVARISIRLATIFVSITEAGLSNTLQGTPPTQITLAIVSPDSTTVYYHVEKGLVGPKDKI